VYCSLASHSCANCLFRCAIDGGQEAGNAIWDVILGSYNPSGSRYAHYSAARFMPLAYTVACCLLCSPASCSTQHGLRTLGLATTPSFRRLATTRWRRRQYLFTKVYNMTDGESREIKLTVEPEQRVVITDETFIRTVEPRPIKLWVGNGQPEQQLQLQALEGEGESGDAGADRRGGVRKYLSGQSGVQQATVGMDGVATALKHC
jgi:hypothetical protein